MHKKECAGVMLRFAVGSQPKESHNVLIKSGRPQILDPGWNVVVGQARLKTRLGV